MESPSFPPASAPQTSSLAILSLISGILGWTVLPLIGSVVAVITGHMAKNEIRSRPDELSGDGLATAGLILGYLSLGAAVLGLCIAVFIFLIFGVSFFTIFANEFSALPTLLAAV